MKRSFLFSSIALALTFGSALPVAHAAIYDNGSATANLNVTLTLQANCTISASPLNFGTNGVLANAVNRQTAVLITCTDTTPYNVGLDAGSFAGSNIQNRLMAGTTEGNNGTTVMFQLYQDENYSTVWGNTQGTDTVAGVGTGDPQSIPIYGQVPAQQTPKPDNYQTIVAATVYF